MTKAALRLEALAAREAAHAAGLDAAAQRALAAFVAPWSGQPLAGYLPMRTEIDPLPVMKAWTGVVGVPLIEGRGLPLTFSVWEHGGPLVPGPFGTARPEVPRPMIPRVLIVPLLGFDRKGTRLGYGGGYYDRTLALLRAAGPVTAVGFAYAAQEFPALPAEPTDAPLDAIVTEEGAREVAVLP